MLSAFPGRLEGCGPSSGEDGRAGRLFGAHMQYAERPGGGGGGEG